VTVTADGCHLFTGATSAKGYGYVNVAGRTVAAHRLVYEMAVGPIPDGYHVDHRCGRRTCIAPEHLRALSPRENDWQARARRRPWCVACPDCGAIIGTPCRPAARRRAHRARIVAATTAAYPTPSSG